MTDTDKPPGKSCPMTWTKRCESPDCKARGCKELRDYQDALRRDELEEMSRSDADPGL